MANLRLLTLKIRTENKIFLKPDFDKLVKIAKSYGWIVKSYKEAEEFIKQHKNIVLSLMNMVMKL